MFLKNYQIKVVGELKRFFQTAQETRDAIETAKNSLPENLRHSLNWVQSAFGNLHKPYSDSCVNGFGNYYPRVCIKVPTGGGKTLLAVEAIREYKNLFHQKRTGLVVWIVPSETIYSQTVRKLRDKSNYLRQLLDQCSGGNTLIFEKGQRLTTQDIEENLVVLFVMIQSISRKNAKEALKVFQDSGGYESFFPPDSRYDLHKQIMEQVPNLDVISDASSAFPQIRTSMGNAIRMSKPFFIIDEIHKVFSDQAKNTIDNLNPEMVLGLSATPKEGMNILVSVTGLELKDEDMIKLDMHIFPPSGSDWKAMIREIKSHRERLEKKAKNLKQDKGIYIRPMALIQVEATGNDQRGKGRVHSLDAKDHLIELGINPDEVAIKTSAQNDIEDVDLFSGDCSVRYIITKEALREGWDCSFAYILGIIPNVGSNTGVTQLVGRILRQPNAKKTGIAELDESYIFYVRGNTGEMLDRVSAGFKNEGLEDLVGKVRLSEDKGNKPKKVRIKKEFADKYANTFYLPVWVMVKNGKEKRRFNYALDIKSQVNFINLELSEEFLEKLISSLSDENRERKSIAVTLDDKSKFTHKTEITADDSESVVNPGYVTRRFAEIVENPFLARKLTDGYLQTVEDKVGKEKLQRHFSFIVSMLVDYLRDERKRQEEQIFLDYLNNSKLMLTVTDDEKLGYKIPEDDVITVSRQPNTYGNYLFDDVEVETMNTLEQKVGQILDDQERILWWFRNKASKNWYAIQGWKEYKIRPDFVAAKKKGKDEFELLYIIESKLYESPRHPAKTPQLRGSQKLGPISQPQEHLDGYHQGCHRSGIKAA
ncbi:MAG: DEAD/DEAH box helicase family protein [Nitrospirae bacterium]|nr:DEAD/DEAH box helicase family protein [Nitrospirota bacterium]